jgi:hypothetical protein
MRASRAASRGCCIASRGAAAARPEGACGRVRGCCVAVAGGLTSRCERERLLRQEEGPPPLLSSEWL